ncbi:MAG TPA: 50S ribosomal protein L21 [Candidatus Paceibacterota bacterium]
MGTFLYMADKMKEFAVIQTGGKQYLVEEGATVKIEKIKGPSTGSGHADYKVGDAVTFADVLVVDNGSDTTLGDPFIKGAKVMGEITKIAKAPKVTVIKYKAKSNYFKKRGHRQPFFEVKITGLK